METHVTSPDPETTEQPDILPENDARYILIPFAVLVGILCLSALVYLMSRNRRRITYIYCRRKYTASDYNIIDNEDEDSDVCIACGGDDFVEDNATECLLKGKLQINNQLESYQSTKKSQHHVDIA